MKARQYAAAAIVLLAINCEPNSSRKESANCRNASSSCRPQPKAKDCATTLCGCSPGCFELGADDPSFTRRSNGTSGVITMDGVGRDRTGPLVLDSRITELNYLWVANTADLGVGTVSKVDAVALKETARYYSITCHSTAGAAGCLDLHGNAIDPAFAQAPSRTAVDYNFDVWVANRAFEGQASATKIASQPEDCIDRNGNGRIDTSADRDGDGKINVDCNADAATDTGATVCTGALAGKQPEFLGQDDECVLFTVNYGAVNELGRSICLAPGVEPGASNAWVGTFGAAVNRFYRIDGRDGQLAGPYPLPEGLNVYGCAVDGEGILWATDAGGKLGYLNTANPKQVGGVLQHNIKEVGLGFYGISIDPRNQVWLGGLTSGHVFRYRPQREDFAALANGSWTAVTHPPQLTQSAPDGHSRGIAADDRGKVWVAFTHGFIWRLDQDIPDGHVDQSASKTYHRMHGAELIGVGVDLLGNVWGVSKANNLASRLEVDAEGNVSSTSRPDERFVAVGERPYTYSDFTGFGLKRVTRPEGRYIYRLHPCKGEQALVQRVSWRGETPGGSQLQLRVRAGGADDKLADTSVWAGPFGESPALLFGAEAANPLSPNPASWIELEFTLKSDAEQVSPRLEGFAVAYTCGQID